MCSGSVFDVQWAASLRGNFELECGVIFEENCKAIALEFGAERVNFDMRAIGKGKGFSGSECGECSDGDLM
jgi:hypothetical protein